MFAVTYANASPAADLLQGVVRTTGWIPARGARCVLFHWKATSGGTPQVAGTPVEGSNSDPIAAGGQSLSGTPGHLLPPIPTTTHVLNNAGGVVHSIYPAAGATFIQPLYVRMSILGAAAATLSALSCTATVLYDGDQHPIPTGIPAAV